ncbi:MAG: hypothetical protein R3B41_01650 [Candidatus Doudnabacteria bacterium]
MMNRKNLLTTIIAIVVVAFLASMAFGFGFGLDSSAFGGSRRWPRHC